MNHRYRLLPLLALPIFTTADNYKAAWHGPDRPLYVVTQNHYAEGFTPEGRTARFGDLIAIEIFNPGAHRADEPVVYKIGEHISLFMGAQRQGEVAIRKVLPLQCDSSAAIVTADSSLHFGKDTMALATNAGNIRPHASKQHEAEAQARGYATQLAKAEFQKNGVPVELLGSMEIQQLVLTALDNSKHQFLIGYFSVKANAARHEVFLIAKMDSPAGAAELARYHKTTDVEDGTDSENIRFVDQLDLDGDGMDEIVIEITGYEDEEFAIYKRSNGHWSQVHLGGGGGC